MTYTVIWKQRALDELAEIWLASDDRERISSAANQIDRWLRNDPESKGESRPANRRLVIVSPLAFVIQVSSPDRLVEIVSVAAFKRKRL
jgi:hypothetical protein